MTEKGNSQARSNSGDNKTNTSITEAERKEEPHNFGTCLFYLDKGLNFVRVNEAFAKASGYRPEELQGKNFFDVFPMEEYQQFFCKVLEDGEHYFAEGEPLKISRQYRNTPDYWDVAIHPILDVDGAPFELVVTLSNATQREHSLQALQESHSLFQHMFESAPDANLLIRMDGTIAKVNRETERMFGYIREELEGKAIETLMPEHNRKKHLKARNQFLQHPSTLRLGENLNIFGLHKDGHKFPVEVSLSPVKVEEETQILVVVRDISQRVEARSALEEKNEIVQLLRDVAVAANGARSVEDALRFALNRICNFLDWPVGQAYIVEPEKGILPSDLCQIKDLERYGPFRAASLKHIYSIGQGMVGRVVMHEGPEWLDDLQTNPDFMRGDAARETGLKTGLALPILTGKETAAVLEFFTDRVVPPIQSFLDILPHVVTQLGRVVERMRAEQELIRSEERFRAIFEGSAIGILMTDINGKVVLSNPALEEMLYYPARQLNGLNMQALLQPEEAPKHRAQVRSLMAETGVYPPLELLYKRKDGSAVWGRNVASVVYDVSGSPRYVITMVEDISQQKQMQDELSELRRLMMANVENERIRLAQDIHDGPIQDLYVINLQLSNLLNEAEDQEAIQESMNAIENVIGSLRETITELRPPTLAQFGLERAIRSHSERMQEANPGLQIHLDLESDHQQLSQPARLVLFRNYKSAVSNVVRHAKAKNLWVRFQMDDERTILEVEDDGRGFEFPRKLVDLVRSGHLGFLGMLERAESMGGKLEVKSSPGKGALIRTVIPSKQDKG